MTLTDVTDVWFCTRLTRIHTHSHLEFFFKCNFSMFWNSLKNWLILYVPSKNWHLHFSSSLRKKWTCDWKFVVRKKKNYDESMSNHEQQCLFYLFSSQLINRQYLYEIRVFIYIWHNIFEYRYRYRFPLGHRTKSFSFYLFIFNENSILFKAKI